MPTKDKLVCDWCKKIITSKQLYMRLGGDSSVIRLVHRTCYEKHYADRSNLTVSKTME